MTYTTESDIEAMARAMMRTVFYEIDVDKASLDWTGNDVWGCDFEVMAKAALAASPVHKELERVKAENERLRDALFDMVWQFCSHNDKLSHSFMSAKEHAFDVLGLENGMAYEEAEKQALQQKGGEG